MNNREEYQMSQGTYNQDISHILKLISYDLDTQQEARIHLLQKWPQLNSGTKISLTQQQTVYMQIFQVSKPISYQVHLENFGWKEKYLLRGKPQRRHVYFTCGYDVETDTLWVRS